MLQPYLKTWKLKCSKRSQVKTRGYRHASCTKSSKLRTLRYELIKFHGVVCSQSMQLMTTSIAFKVVFFKPFLHLMWSMSMMLTPLTRISHRSSTVHRTCNEITLIIKAKKSMTPTDVQIQKLDQPAPAMRFTWKANISFMKVEKSIEIPSPGCRCLLFHEISQQFLLFPITKATRWHISFVAKLADQPTPLSGVAGPSEGTGLKWPRLKLPWHTGSYLMSV